MGGTTTGKYKGQRSATYYCYNRFHKDSFLFNSKVMVELVIPMPRNCLQVCMW